MRRVTGPRYERVNELDGTACRERCCRRDGQHQTSRPHSDGFHEGASRQNGGLAPKLVYTRAEITRMRTAQSRSATKRCGLLALMKPYEEHSMRKLRPTFWKIGLLASNLNRSTRGSTRSLEFRPG